MRFTTGDLVEATGGRLVGPEVEVGGASIDSRTLRAGELFVPVRAARDGHDYIEAALGRGAAAYFTEGALHGGTAIVVDDAVASLTALAGHARERLGHLVVGITGSVGKTTVKDLTAAVLRTRWTTGASEASHNNELGVPLTLVNAPDGAEAAVVEMGARGRGQIAALCAVARPTIGVVTAVAKAHTALFGDVEEVARAKRELVEALPADGTAVLNADQPLVSAMGSVAPGEVVTFGMRGDVRAEAVELDSRLRPHFRLITPTARADVSMDLAGEHQVTNALAAAAVGVVAGLSADAIATGLAAATPATWRMAIGTAAGGATILNDAYNANPTSMTAGLRALATLSARRRVAVLGAMAELGPSADADHEEMSALAASLDVTVIAVDAPAYGDLAHHVADAAAARAQLGDLGPDDAVLVKGSRVAGLERLAAELLGR